MTEIAHINHQREVQGKRQFALAGSRQAKNCTYEFTRSSACQHARSRRVYRRLQQVTTCIHDTENLSQLMLDVSPDICSLFNADQ